MPPFLCSTKHALRERERSPAAIAAQEAQWGDEALRLRPFVMREMPAEAGWRVALLEGELRRLVWLAEVEPLPVQRDGWMECSTRYWAIAIGLMRIGQLYAAVSQEQGGAWAERMLARATRQVGSQVAQAA
jgi:hypothetical protein